MRAASRLVLVSAIGVALGACSSSPPPSPQQVAAARKAAAEAQAGRKLDMYRKLVAMKNYPLAVPIGQEILDRYPGTQAAAEVGKSLPGIKATSEAEAETQRLANLWLYQVGPQSGGTQSTAAIPASKPPGIGVRLILRRHSAWGESAYLYNGGGKGFACKGQCDLHAQFDGHARHVGGYLPNGGEPAMFIKDDKAFIAAMEKAKTVTLKVDLKDAGPTTLEFEVGGFDASKWQPVPRKK